jgi:palmitoyl-protein thioesterase
MLLNAGKLIIGGGAFLLIGVMAPLSMSSAVDGRRECEEQEREDHPILCNYMDRLLSDPQGMSHDIHSWAEAQGLLIDFDSCKESSSIPSVAIKRRLGESVVPVVMAHGMGDSCFNDGMQHINQHVSDLLGGVYSTCIPTGKDRHEDTTNGYFLNMDASVDVFAESVRRDPKLANGFHAIGFSQGNNVIRGYIARYNDPPVNTFISVNGVNAGVGAVPYCRPKSVEEEKNKLAFSMCDLLMEQASNRAYTEYAQEHLFQANYWRDPRPSEADAYKSFAQLARWNNECDDKNTTFNENFAKTRKFVWIMAEQDGMVFPKQGEHWGAPDPEDPFNKILPMKETEWYKNDLFGLKEANEAGKMDFLSFDGDHLQFTMKDFDSWVTTYLS